jgi:hypothetical protein
MTRCNAHVGDRQPVDVGAVVEKVSECRLGIHLQTLLGGTPSAEAVSSVAATMQALLGQIERVTWTSNGSIR